ncbi:hypothetical protein N7453_003488 [Penicillium expansum]|nr:hypothetical protein N7453_003488 [Penicillium expansum]
MQANHNQYATADLPELVMPITETGVPEVRRLRTALSTDLRRQSLNSTLPKLLPVALHYPRGRFDDR